MLYTKRTFDYEHDLKEADVALLGIPWDSTETGKSVKHGPLFIREAIRNMPGRDPESGNNPFGKLKFCDLGDLEVVPGSWDLTKERIRDTVSEMFSTNGKVFPVFLGGDHLITLGILDSLPHEKITVVYFDAHRDLLADWMGNPYVHITWAHHIINNPRFDLIQVGCRSWSEEEDKLIDRLKDISDNIDNPIYITVDMDVFDPGFAPDVGTPEPCGLAPDDFLKTLKTVCKNRVIGLDIVECASDRVNTPTATLAAYVIKKALAYRF